MQTAYVAIIEKGLDGYGVFFPDIPGLTSFGATPGEAAANAAVAAQGHIALMQELGDTLAPPTALEDVEVEDDVQEVARVMILVETADEKQRVNITLAKSVLAALDGIAGVRGQDRSSMIADLVRDYCQAPRVAYGGGYGEEDFAPANTTAASPAMTPVFGGHSIYSYSPEPLKTGTLVGSVSGILSETVAVSNGKIYATGFDTLGNPIAKMGYVITGKAVDFGHVNPGRRSERSSITGQFKK